MSSRDQRVVADTPQRSATSASNSTQFGLRTTSKIKDIHLNRLAIAYVRQSSPQRVMENRESGSTLSPNSQSDWVGPSSASSSLMKTRASAASRLTIAPDFSG